MGLMVMERKRLVSEAIQWLERHVPRVKDCSPPL